MRILSLGAAAAMVASSTAADASAGPPWASLGDAAGPASSDGERYAAWERPDGTTALYDGATGRVQSLESPPGMTLIGLGGGVVGWQQRASEPGAFPAARMLTLSTGVVADAVAPAPDPLSPCTNSGMSVRYTAVGAEGLAGTCTDRGSLRFRLNWRTGRLVLPATLAASPTIEDLDRPTLDSPPCAPLAVQRTPTQEMESDTRDIPLFDNGVWTVTYDSSRPDRSGRDVWKAVRIQRCGRARSRVLDPGPLVSGLTLGAQQAAWFRTGRRRGTRPAARVVVLYQLDQHALTILAAPRSVPGEAAPQRRLATLDRGVVLSVQGTGAQARTWQIKFGVH